MARRFEVGDVLLVPVSEQQYVPTKVVFLSKRTKGLVILAASTDALVDEAAMPQSLPKSWPMTVLTFRTSLVNGDPSKAIADMEEEKITHLPAEVFEEKFGERIQPSDISRETGSNKAGWG